MRGGEGLDFSPLFSHYVFLFTFVLAFAGWWTAFIGQAIATSDFGDFGGGVGTLWFGIFLELAVILGVGYTLASDSLGRHRFQVSIFTAVALVFSVGGTNGLYAAAMSVQAYGAGWLLLTIVNIIWLLYFTSEEDSLIFHIFTIAGGGTGGLTPPSRNRRRNPSVHTAGAGVRQSGIGNGAYGTGISSTNYGGGGLGGGATGATFDVERNGNPVSTGTPKAGSFTDAAAVGSNRSGVGAAGQSPRTPLILPGANTSGGDPNTSGGQARTSAGEESVYQYRARALYAYTASPSDPNEISFQKGEILDIVDNQGKWWQAKRSDGETGIAPSNYLQII